MSSRRAPYLLGMIALSLPLLGATPLRFLPGSAMPYRVSADEGSVDWQRMDRLSGLARRIDSNAKSWSAVAFRLESAGQAEFGPLTAKDRYWLGSAWWALHQPDHIRHPDWAIDARLNPDLVLRHLEGGNCDSSANGHAALLNALGVPTIPVYGYHHGAREGHVWTMSDVGGRPMLADVHLARGMAPVWRPRPEDVMATSSTEAAVTFMRLRTPDNPNQRGYR